MALRLLDFAKGEKDGCSKLRLIWRLHRSQSKFRGMVGKKNSSPFLGIHDDPSITGSTLTAGRDM